VTRVTRLELYSHEDEIRTSSAELPSTLYVLPALIFLVISGECVDTWTPGANMILPLIEHFHFLTNEFAQMPGLSEMISASLLHTLLLENVVPSNINNFVPSLDLTSGSPKYPCLLSLTNKMAISNHIHG
jgi:hypothetical protein